MLSNNNFALLPKDFNQHPGIYLSACLLAVVALFYLLSVEPILQKPLPVTTYQECLNAPDSRLQESYPSICVTSDNQQFIQPTPQPSPSASASALPSHRQ